ncbi:hypothetical protein [Brachyspira catarrhinii]|uniref:DUF3568 family protein n=1 Tax=Brachyspira catarrhinii TaxID=2528966 RepID=A0ABY2TR26_9SPIR|nr:hypothetical protein [Brachyspira catarrhinii]TKZ35284.1 hypothetical protein EZH24_06060 [Brachyspira catarrhinii]
MKKVLIILFFASVLIYAKAEAHIFYVYSEGAEQYVVEAVENAFMRAGHQITKEKSYVDYFVSVSMSVWVEDKLWGLSKVEKAKLTITVLDPRTENYIGRESVEGKSDNLNGLADKVVKNIRKYLKK